MLSSTLDKDIQFLQMRLSLLIIFFFLNGFTYSQVLIIDRDNIESDSLKKQKLSAYIGFGFNINKQKTRVLDLKQTADIGYLFKDHALYLITNAKLIASGSNELINSGFLHTRYRWQRNKVVQPEFFGQYQWEGSRGMEERILAGANMRFRLQNDSSGTIYFGIGLMHEHEVWNYSAVDAELLPPNINSVTVNRAKLNSYLKITREFSPSAALVIIGFIQSGPNENIKYPRIASNAKLQFKITKSIDFAVTFDNIYDPRPVVPIDNHYYTLGNNLIIKF